MSYPLSDEAKELLGITDVDVPSTAPGGLQGGVPGADMIAGDAYEGASNFSKALSTFNPPVRSADQDLRTGKKLADVRSRDLIRNDGKLQGGATIRKDNIVGSYFMLNAKPNSKRLFGKEDDKWESEFQEEVEEIFAADAESFDCYLDAAGRNTLTGLTRMAVDQHTSYGEVLASVEWKRRPGRPCNTAVQMIDTDRLCNPMNTVDPNIVMGVELDEVYNEPVAYHFRMDHPSEWRTMKSGQWKRVPAKLRWGRKQMIHIFEQLRPGQTRGIGIMVSAIPEMKMSKQFRQLVLQNAILNATYAATIESELPADAIFARLGGSDYSPADVEKALQGFIGGHYQTMANLMGGAKNLQIDGVKIPHLPPGTKLNLHGAGDGGPLGTDFEVALDRVHAAALGISYEQYSRDFTKTNYSGFKGAMSETYKTMISVKRMIADNFASTIFKLWLEEMLNKGQITSIKRNMPSWYEGRNAEWYSACDWVGASRGQVDELKETQAAILRINNGLSTREQELARLGQDWRKVLRQMKREMELADFYKVLQDTTDTTNQQNAANPSSGKPRKTNTALIPSAGTADAMFTDSEIADEVEE